MVLPVLINCIIYVVDVWRDAWALSGICMSYANPLNITCAVSLLFIFSKLNVKYSRFINWIAASSFAAYLFHFDFNILKKHYCRISEDIFNSFDGINCLMVYFVYLCLIFAIAVLLDQPRKFIWQRLERKLFCSRKQPSNHEMVNA